MKSKIFHFISTIMLFVPWSIFLLRMNAWALQSPAAEISISCYAAFMIFSGIFTIWGYAKERVRDLLPDGDFVKKALFPQFYHQSVAFCLQIPYNKPIF